LAQISEQNETAASHEGQNWRIGLAAAAVLILSDMSPLDLTVEKHQTCQLD